MASLPTQNNVSRITRFRVFIGETEIGSLSNLNLNETRDVSPHFTIGGANPEDPKALIPGVVRTRTLTANYFALFRQNVLTLFEKKGIPATADVDVVKTLRDQKTPFEIKVTEIDPAAVTIGTGTPRIVTTYVDCMISDYRSTRDIVGADVRIAEDVTIMYRTVS